MTAKITLVRYVEAKTSTARAAAALNRLDAEIGAAFTAAKEMEEKARRSFFAAQSLLAKTRQRERLEAAYADAVAAEKTAREKWTEVAATMTAQELRSLRMKF